MQSLSLVVFGLSGVALCVLGVFARPKIALCVVASFCLVAPSISLQPGLGILRPASLFLEIVLATMLSIMRLVGGLKLRMIPGLRCFLIFLFLGYLSGVRHGVHDSLMTQEAVLLTKGFLFAFMVAQLDWSHDDIPQLRKYFAAVTIGSVGCALANIFSPQSWLDLTSPGTQFDLRGGIPSLIGAYSFPLVYGQTMALVTGTQIALAFAERSSTFKRVPIVLVLLVLTGLSFRREVFLGLLAGIIISMLVTRRKGTGLLVVVILPFFVLFAAPTIASVATSTHTQYSSGTEPRSYLSQGAFDIASRDFPLGAGLGRYGSFMASTQYSPEYMARGFEHIYGLSPTAPNNAYLTDTHWPQVLGEAGYLGLLAYLAALFLIGKAIFCNLKTEDGRVSTLGLVTLLSFAQCLIYSTAGPIYNTAPQYLFLFAPLGVLVSRGQSTARKTNVRTRLDPASRRLIVYHKKLSANG